MIFALISLQQTLVLGALGLILCALSDARPAVKAVRSRFEKLREESSGVYDDQTENETHLVHSRADRVRSESLTGDIVAHSSCPDVTLPLFPLMSKRRDSPELELAELSDTLQDEEDIKSWTTVSSLTGDDWHQNYDACVYNAETVSLASALALSDPKRTALTMDSNLFISLFGLLVGFIHLVFATLTEPKIFSGRGRATVTSG